MRTSDFIGRWKLLDAEVTLNEDGTWKLKRGVQKLPWFDAVGANEGKWGYARGNLGFARSEGGVGVRFQVFRVDKSAVVISDSDGEPIELPKIT